MAIPRRSTIREFIGAHKKDLKLKGFTVIRFNVKRILDFCVEDVVKGVESEGFKCIVKYNDSRSVYIRAKKVRQK